MNRDRTHWLAWIGLFFAALAIVFLRAPEMVLAPSLLFDEGSKVFAYFYEQRGLAEILRFKSGYLPLFGNLIGYIAVRLPTRAIPYALAGSAVLITGLTYSLFFARFFRRWIPSDLDRALICLLFALAPISDCLLVTMSDYSLWNLLAALILLTVWRPTQRTGWRLLHGFACNLLVWSHPLTIIIAPVVLWRAFKDRENLAFYRLLFFNVVVHQVFGVAGIVTTQGLWDHGTGVALAVSFTSKFLHSCAWTLQIIAATAFRTAFGSPCFASVVRDGPALLIIWTGFLIAASLLIACKIPRTRPLLIFLACLIASVTFLSCFLRYEDVNNDPMHFISYSPRYIYLQSLCFLLLFGTLVTAGWEVVRGKVTEPPGEGWFKRLAFLPLAALVCHYYILNTQFGHYLVGNTQRAGPYYDPDPQNGLIVREFFSKLADEEKAHGSWHGIQLTAQKVNDWPITVNTTVSQLPTNVRLSRRARLLALALGLVALSYVTRGFWMQWVSPRRVVHHSG
jgi:hypothetical protein